MKRTSHRYGPHRSQVGDLWLPAAPDGRVPLVVLIHGGFWRGVVNKRVMHRLAAAITARGWAAWNVEYRRVGNGGGGWPRTFVDVATALDHVVRLGEIDLDRVITCGHSAGGHLALWLASQDRSAFSDLWPETGPSQVRLRGAVALAGISDLEAAVMLDLGKGAVTDLLGGSVASVPDRYRATSPSAMLPLGVPQVLVHGLADQVVPPQMSETYAGRARAAGDSASYVPLDGLSHRELIRARSVSWDAIAERMSMLFA
jgi:acetyl esterase/lipase